MMTLLRWLLLALLLLAASWEPETPQGPVFDDTFYSAWEVTP